jgi:hypothetical protein
MPWHQGGLSRSRPNRDFDRDRGNPEIPANSGSENPGNFPNPGQAKSAKSGFNPGKSQFFWTARTVIADCQRQARLVRFLIFFGFAKHFSRSVPNP